MRILLTMNLPWVPATGGANKCNRAFAEGLARRGHTVEAVVPALAVPARWSREEMLAHLESQGVPVERAERGADFDLFRMAGVEVRAVADPARLRAVLSQRLRAGSPDWVVLSSEDPSQNLLDAALKARVAPVVYIAHTPAHLPFGPQAFYPSERRSRMLRGLAGCIGVSGFVADYLRQWGGLEGEVLRFPIYGEGPYPNFGGAGDPDGFVTLVNPCAVKGIDVFLGLARALPEVRFTAVPTWGTTPADRAALAALPNVTLLEPEEDIDRIFARTRVLLMPSLWQEAFGVTAVEAMLRGIPVLASDVGGLPEATLGVGTPLPVHAIDGFADRHDANEIPAASVPEQDLGPWIQALTALLDDPAAYARRSEESRNAALRFVEGIDVASFERFFERLPRRLPEPEAAPAAGSALAASGDAAGVAELTPEQRALLMLRLRKKAAGGTEAGGTDRRRSRG